MDDIELAGKYGLLHQIDGNFGKELMVINEKKIKAFAAKIRADEREICAKLCDAVGDNSFLCGRRLEQRHWRTGAFNCAKAIRELK